MTAPPPVLLLGAEADTDAGWAGGASPRRLPAALLADPPPEGRVLGLGGLDRPVLRAGVAVVLAGPVGAGATPELAYLAVAGSFLCVELASAREEVALLVAEDVLPDPGDGVLRLDLDGGRLAELPIELPGTLPGRLAALAAAGAGLAAGSAVAVLGPAVPARPGTLLLTGPGRSSLVAALTAEPAVAPHPGGPDR